MGRLRILLKNVQCAWCAVSLERGLQEHRTQNEVYTPTDSREQPGIKGRKVGLFPQSRHVTLSLGQSCEYGEESCDSFPGTVM